LQRRRPALLWHRAEELDLVMRRKGGSRAGGRGWGGRGVVYMQFGSAEHTRNERRSLLKKVLFKEQTEEEGA